MMDKKISIRLHFLLYFSKVQYIYDTLEVNEDFFNYFEDIVDFHDFFEEYFKTKYDNQDLYILESW